MNTVDRTIDLGTFRLGDKVMYRYEYGNVGYQCEFIQPLCRHLIGTLTGDTVTVLGTDHLGKSDFLITYSISIPSQPNLYKIVTNINIHEKGKKALNEAVSSILPQVQKYLEWKKLNVVEDETWSIEWE